VHSLLLYGSFATFVRTDDHPWMPSIEDRERANELGAEVWGSGAVLSTFVPKAEVTPESKEFAATFESRAASPGAMVALTRMNMQIDVRSVLSSISVPTMVVHATGDRIIPVESGRYLADRIPGARLVEFDMRNHLSLEPRWIDAWYDDYAEFVTGSRPAGPVVDRVLSTVMFTDIVDSTRAASERGDTAWKQLLDRHDDITQREVARFRGTVVKHTGDGVLARFDGPARAVSCGLATCGAVKALGIDIRTGVHTGEIELRGDDVGGIAVHVGARVMALAVGGQVLVTRTVRDLTAGSGLTFDERGKYELKGVPDEWQIYEARG
jgi:class 3 adenylate cyclase